MYARKRTSKRLCTPECPLLWPVGVRLSGLLPDIGLGHHQVYGGAPDPECPASAGREVITMTANGRLLERPITGSVVRSAMSASPRPLNADHMHFAALATAPFWARQYTRMFLRHCHGITTDTAENAELLVSELVTNAYLSTCNSSVPKPSYSQRVSAEVISLSLRRFRNGLLIEVIDSSPEPPVLIQADSSTESGRGLMLVDSLSQEWGYFPMPNGGKVVYCFVRIT
jgi:anti-sigma regulatory factor (Ser/Thr protein kinase)